MVRISVRTVQSTARTITLSSSSLPYSGLLAEVDRALGLQGKRVSVYQGGEKLVGDTTGRVQLEDGGVHSWGNLTMMGELPVLRAAELTI